MVKPLRNLIVLANANWRKRKAHKEMLKCSQICRRQINGFEGKLILLLLKTRSNMYATVCHTHLYADFFQSVLFEPSVGFQIDSEMH